MLFILTSGGHALVAFVFIVGVIVLAGKK